MFAINKQSLACLLLLLCSTLSLGHERDLCAEMVKLGHTASDDLGLAEGMSDHIVASRVSKGTLSLGYGFTSQKVWVKVDAEGISEDQRCYLQIGNPHLDRVEVYFSGLQDSKLTFGDHLPFEERPVAARKLAIPFDGGQSFLVGITSTSSITTPVAVMNANSLQVNEMNDNFLMGIFMGMMLILVFMGVQYALTHRVRAYGIYSLSVFGYLLFFLSGDGYLYQYLWPHSPKIRSYALLYFALATIASTTWYYATFLRIRTGLLAWIARLFIFACLSMMVLIPLLPIQSSWQWATQFSLILAPVTLLLSGVAVLGGDVFARYLFVGAVISALGVVAYAASVLGWIEINLLSEHAIKLATLADFACLSLAIRRQVRERLARQAMYKGVFESTQMTAHDILRPLAKIQQLMHGKIDGLEKKKLIAEIDDVHDMLMEMMASAGNKEVKGGKSDIGATLADILPAEFKLTPPPATVVVPMSRLGLKRVVQNITNNALAAVDGKAAKFWCEVDHLNDTIQIRLGNTQSSIAARHLEKIFDIFKLARNSKGFGIGLAFVKHQVEASGGTVICESNGVRSDGSKAIQKRDEDYVEFQIQLPLIGESHGS